MLYRNTRRFSSPEVEDFFTGRSQEDRIIIPRNSPYLQKGLADSTPRAKSPSALQTLEEIIKQLADEGLSMPNDTIKSVKNKIAQKPGLSYNEILDEIEKGLNRQAQPGINNLGQQQNRSNANSSLGTAGRDAIDDIIGKERGLGNGGPTKLGRSVIDDIIARETKPMQSSLPKTNIPVPQRNPFNTGINPLVQTDLDKLHNLDFSNPAHKDHFDYIIKRRVGGSEGASVDAYDDKTGKKINSLNGEKRQGNTTIGKGFNMEAAGAREKWKKIGVKPDFDEIKSGKGHISKDEVERLLDASLKDAEEKTKNRINGADSTGKESHPGTFEKLKPNEKAALVDATYNSDRELFRNNKDGSPNPYDVRDDIRNYAKSGDDKYLKNASKKMQDFGDHMAKQNEKTKGGLRKRYKDNADLLDSSNAALRSKPGEKPLPDKYKGKYCRWVHNTSSSGKPNKLHQDRNGKIVEIGSDEWKEMETFKGCKCTCEPIE